MWPGWVLAACLVAGPAVAATRHYHADLNGGTERPPTDSAGGGVAEVSVDTVAHTLDYTLSFTGLSGAATAAHIHGPAPMGKNAGVVINFGANPQSPVHGTAKVTDAQLDALDGGSYYVNVHTAAHPGGEIRGQLVPAP
jgi:hypothetical protein